MTRRLRLYGELFDRHAAVFTAHAKAALLAQESISITRLHEWEQLVLANQPTDLGEATFGDGGMAAHVRIASARERRRR